MSPSRLSEALRVFYRHPTPWLLSLTIAIAFSIRVYLGGLSLWDLVIVLGLLGFWPVQEWLIHVFILHAKPRRIFGWTFDSYSARKHRAHHRDPLTIEILFIPLRFLFLGIVLHTLAWNLLMPNASLAFTGVTAYFVLTLHYEWIHYLVHTRYKPKSARYQRLWRNHRLHHFKNEHYWFGVTMLGGDRLLGTAAPHTQIPTSQTCRSLGHDEDLGIAA